MVGVTAKKDSTRIQIFGYGFSTLNEFEVVPGVFVSPERPSHSLKEAAAGCEHFRDYAAVILGREIATFSVRVEDPRGGRNLASKAWNALWLFHLLSIACRNPCISLYSVCDGSEVAFVAANPSPFMPPLDNIYQIDPHDLEWAQQHYEKFEELIKVNEFSTAIRSYIGSYLLPQHDVRIMLIWAGIEGLLRVDAELSRRIALYAAILHDGTPVEKAQHFRTVRSAYGVRSRAVHGSGLKPEKLREGSKSAAEILIGLLARCVELGRVPMPDELDQLAVTPTIS